MPYEDEKIIAETPKEIHELLEKIGKTELLSEMIMLALELAKQIAVKAVETALAKRAQARCNWPQCPQCGAQIGNKDRQPRQIKSLIGVIHWRRKVGRCPNGCEIGQVVPLDQELGIAPDQHVSTELQHAACALAVFVPYGIAAVLLALLTKIQVSPASIWSWVQACGEQAKQQLAAELAAMHQGHDPEPEPLPPAVAALTMVIGGDGVFVPFRPTAGSRAGTTQFQEVKVGIIARLKQFMNRQGREVLKIQHKRVVAVLGNIDQLAERLRLEALKQGIRHAPTVVWISDGARGLWRIYRDTLSRWAVGILDFYHAAQHLWQTASAWLDGRTTQAKTWFTQQRHQLRHGDPAAVIHGIQQALQPEDLSAAARTSLENLVAYLAAHEQHLDYAYCKALGLPIGSGMVESACKWLIQQRFKCVGMRWSEPGFDNLLHLRLAWVNGRFHQLFSITPP